MKKWSWGLLGVGGLLLSLAAVIVLVSAYDYNRLKPQVTAAVLGLTGRELTIKGDIRLKLGLAPALAMADVALQNAPWAGRAHMATAKRLELKAALLPLLQGIIRIDRLLLDTAEVYIEIGPAGRSNLAFDPAVPETADSSDGGSGVAFRLGAVREIAVKNSSLRIDDLRNGRTDHLALSSLEMQGLDLSAGGDLQLDAVWNEIPVAVKGRIGALKGLREPGEPWPLDLSVEALQGIASVKGRIQDPLGFSGVELLVTAEGRDLAQLGNPFGGPLPLKGRYRFSGKLAARSPDDISVSDLGLVIEDSLLKGELRIERHSERYRYSGRLSAERLDLRPVLSREKAQGTRQPSPPARPAYGNDRVFSDDPVELEALGRLDLDLELDIGLLLLPHLAVERLKTAARLSDGRLVIDPMTAGVGGGTLKGSLVLETQAPQASSSVVLVVEGLDLEVMAKTLGVKDISGRAGLDFQLHGRGRSIAGMMGSLNGDAVISVKDTRIPLAYVDVLGATMATVSKRLLQPFDEPTAPATIHCLVGDFFIRDGLAKTDVLVADTDRVSLSGLGTINLRSEEIALGIKARSKEGVGTSATGKVSIDFAGIANVFQVTGTLAHPSYGVSTEKSLKALATAAGLTFLTGPFGLASLFISRADTAQDPCAAALAAAGPGPITRQPTPSAGGEKKKGLGDRLRGLFE